ncbi:MAG TPA: ABC transporter ATP-binding protein [Ktedonobacterales bacterium]|nr:ABC transporter ATP-binding protein [Ktedonobacterales bacterium]
MKPLETVSGPGGLHADFELRRAAFHLRASLTAPPGLTALLGPSGAGKSLTLQAIAELAGIERGAINLNGRALADTRTGVMLAPRLRRVGYVPQSYALFPHLSVAANIAYGLPRNLDRVAREKRVANLLRLARLPGYETRRTHDLSGGEAQRVALARALAAEPEALLLDEPFSALDAPTRANVRDDLRAMALASGLPTVLVTHDLGEALALATRLALLVNGHVIAQGTAEDVTRRPETALAARLLGWGATLAISQVERRTGGLCVTLARCGQSLPLALEDCADAALTSDIAQVALAMRPERLRVARVDSSSAYAQPDRACLRGVIRAVSTVGPLWSAQVALSLDNDATGAMLDLPFSAREWQSLDLATGDTVALEPMVGAARLVTSDHGNAMGNADGAGEEAQQ